MPHRKEDRRMGIEVFREMVCTSLQERLGEGIICTPKDVTKNNGVVWHGILIAEEGCNITPCIYLDDCLSDYEKGASTEDILEGIKQTYENRMQQNCFDRICVSDFGNIRENIRIRLINTGKNADILKSQPHRDFLDLSIAYYVEFPFGTGVGSIQIWNEHMEMWGISEEDLYQQAMANIDAEGGEQILNMKDVLCEMAGLDDVLSEDAIPMFILTNKRKIHGASQIVREDVLETIGLALGKDYIIIPSSIHEVLLVPDTGEPELTGHIAEMVDCVNNTEVAENEVLSYHVYRYSRSEGKISIAA